MSISRGGVANGTPKDANERYNEHFGLLWKLKATIESLLAANTSNVWSMYGGLNRLANQLDVVFKHGLIPDACPDGDYWNFVFGLRRIQPVLAPSVDQLSRRAEQEGRLKGLLWLQDSLENHTLSFQLRLLVSESSLLREFYYDDAFLCSAAHSTALDTLLQAVEQNNACLLAQVDPSLLQKCPSSQGIEASHSSPRLSRAPCLSAARDVVPPATDQNQCSPDSLLFTSPKGESVLETMEAPAFGQSKKRNLRRNSAKDALKALLDGTAGQGFGSSNILSEKAVQVFRTDPLLNRPVASIARESFQRSQGLMRAESDTALMRVSGAMTGHMDENENSRFNSGLKQKRFDAAAQNGDSDSSLTSRRSRRGSAMYWEDTEGSVAENSEQDIHSKLVFNYDNSPSSSAYARTLDSSTEEVASPKSSKDGSSDSLEPVLRAGYRTKDLRGSRNSSRQSLLIYSNEQLLFSEEEEDQIGFLGEITRKGRESRGLLRRNSEDWDAKPSSPPPIKQKYMRHSRSKSDQISNVRGGGLDVYGRDSGQEGTSHRTTKNGRRHQASNDDIYSSSLPADTATIRRLSDVGSFSPACDGYFPQPTQGESLFTFLSSQDFATCPEVDKENAHFCISEAIIAAVEQIKCHQMTRQTPSDHDSDGSDEEIQHLKQRIRLRRSEKREQKMQSENDAAVLDFDIGNPVHDELASLQYLSDSDESIEEAEDFVVTDSSTDTNMVAMKAEGLTASLGSLYSDADLKRANQMHPVETVLPIAKIDALSASNQLSAESIALSLIKKFSFRQLPAASELEWLVSEKDAPQQLLPLPKSVPISPDDGENADLYKNMRLRGNLEWAPPRPQIVFSIHPPPKRKQLVAKQNFRCAGCGMKVERGFFKRLRYCEYLGKYFCQCCHTNASAPIPSRILRKWDFSRYPVSNFSQELLSKIQTDPVFNVADINPILYRKVRQMQSVKELRTQLFYLKDFLKTCRLCDSLKALYDNQQGHWMGHPDLYSISDLILVRAGEMEKALIQLVGDGVTHVNQCQLCQAKGFVCTLCNNDQIIFPFQLHTTYQCSDCWACYHTSCFLKEDKCAKCERILARRGIIAVKSETSDEDQQSPLAS